jgi:hypothetical protein
MRITRAIAAIITRILDDIIINNRIFCFRGIVRGPIDVKTLDSDQRNSRSLLILQIAKAKQ